MCEQSLSLSTDVITMVVYGHSWNLRWDTNTPVILAFCVSDGYKSECIKNSVKLQSSDWFGEKQLLTSFENNKKIYFEDNFQEFPSFQLVLFSRFVGLLGLSKCSDQMDKSTVFPVQLGDVIISKEATLEDLKLQIQTLPIMTEVSWSLNLFWNLTLDL